MQINKITVHDINYVIKMSCTQIDGEFLVFNTNNELKIDAAFDLKILNDQTFRLHINKFKIINKKKNNEELVVTSLIEFASFYVSKFHKFQSKAPVIIIENGVFYEESFKLPILQFYPARDEIYISCYNAEVENEWLISTAMIDDISIDTYRDFFRRMIIPRNYFLNEELLDTKISGAVLNKDYNYLFNHTDLSNKIGLLSPHAKNLHYKNLYFPHVNMEAEHPNFLNSKVMNLKNLNKTNMTLSGYFFEFSNCTTTKINLSLDFLGEPAEHSLIFLDKFRYSQIKVFQKRVTHKKDNIKTPFIFLKNCKSCDIITKPTTFFVIADSHKEKYENRSIIVDASADDLYHNIIFLTNNSIEIENDFKQIISWEHMEVEEKVNFLSTFKDLLPSLKTRYKMDFPYIEESLLKAIIDNSHIDKLNPKLMSYFLRNIRNMESDQTIEYSSKRK